MSIFFLDLFPYEILFKIAANLNFDDIESLCATSNRLSVMCNDNEFWITISKNKFGITRVQFLDYELDPLSGKERFLQLSSREGGVFFGSEKYVGLTELIYRAAKGNKRPLLNYFLSISNRNNDLELSEKNFNAIMDGASAGGNLDLLKYAISEGARITLVPALEGGNKKVIDYLLTLQSFKNDGEGAFGISKQTQLVLDSIEAAARYNRRETLFKLFSLSNYIPHTFQSGLNGAAQGGNMELVLAFSNMTENILEDELSVGSALISAFRGGNSEIITLIMEVYENMDVFDQIDLDMQGIMCAAVWHGDLEIIRRLIEIAEEKDMQIEYNKLLEPAFMNYRKGSTNKIIEYLISKGANDFLYALTGIKNSIGKNFNNRENTSNLKSVEKIHLLKQYLNYYLKVDPLRVLTNGEPSNDISVNKLLIKTGADRGLFLHGMEFDRYLYAMDVGQNLIDIIAPNYNPNEVDEED